MFQQLHALPSQEPGVIQFRSDTLQFRIMLNTATFQSLHLKTNNIQGKEILYIAPIFFVWHINNFPGSLQKMYNSFL